MAISNSGSDASRLRVAALAGVALYALFLFATPFEHHDLSCELKTPDHCTACVASAVGADPQIPTAPGAGQLTDAGSAVPRDLAANSLMLVARSTGRSPPALV
ncbi:MAG TPA: hypothetical protein VMS04_11450 [Vicinamibacterales bacterium]|nr:hypothetical protein [Vicinamibacterales bacterium]